MRKYLITGVLALAAGGFLTSCHDTEGAYSSIVEQKLQAYEQVFKEEFGEIDPNQDWGFGGTSTSAARTRAENKNLNEWGDPAKNGGQAWNVPPALTERQKLRVRLYFQYNPRLTYIDPEFTDFFVQQVYKGNPLTQGPYSPEEYYRVNEEKFTGSNEMDHLVCGNDTHINDFNDGEWNGGVPYEVLNTGANANDHQGNTTHVEGVTHPDQITLMVQSSTEYIGYGASTVEGAKRRDCCANAGAKTIDDWVDSPEAQALGISDFGDPVYDPAWNRSFVGLDYEAMKKADALSTESVKALDLKEDGVDFVLYQGQFIKVNEFSDFVLTDKDGNEVKYVSDNVSNEAVGQKMKYTAIENGQEVLKDVTKSTFKKMEKRTVLEQKYKTTIQGNSDIWYYDLDMVINDYIKKDCNPTKSNKNMIKNIGGRDYVFSDWIVTLTEAKKVGSPDTQIIPIITNTDETTTSGWHQEGYIVECENSGRVFCEDLGVVRASDIDFNDLVFDAYIFKKTPVTRYWKKDSDGNTVWWKDETKGDADYYAEVYLLAAGGTLDLTISGKKDDGTIVGSKSVKPYMNVGKTTILNTIMLGGEAYGNESDIKTQAPEKLVFEGVSSIANIPIVVFYKEEDRMTALELKAFKGAAPHKLCVPIDTQWPIERAEVSLAYPNFTNYVKGQDSQGKKIIWRPNGTTENDGSYYEEVNNLWNNKNTNYLYTNTVSYTVPDTSSKFESTGVVVEDQSTTTTGGYNNETILIRRRN